MYRIISVISIVILGIFSGCIRKPVGKSLWIYTSIYKDVVAELDPILKKQFPGVTFEWYQSGSENVATRVNAELTAGRSQADLILTSDPFWYEELQEKGHLLQVQGIPTLNVAKQFSEGSNSFVTVRLPIAVIAYNREVFPGKFPVASWSDLLNDKQMNQVSMGSPVESGTAFSVVAQLVRSKGWDFFVRLRQKGVLAAGGNSAVINRIETKERPIGITLLENVLEARKRGSPIDFIYPLDGAIWVPSPVAAMAKSRNPELSRSVLHYFFSTEMQSAIIRGRMYSPVLQDVAPEGGRPFKWVVERSMPWSSTVLKEIFVQREEIKRRFAETVMH